MFGEYDLNVTLDSIICAGEIKIENYHQILVDISWWLIKLHGDDSVGWNILHGALDPSKIGVVRQNGKLRAYIMNYKFAQDIARSDDIMINNNEDIDQSSTDTCVCCRTAGISENRVGGRCCHFYT